MLGAAIDDSRRVDLAYRDEAGRGTARTIRPLGLYFWGRVWTLVAWCELREGFRMFRVDRIEHLETGLRYRPVPEQSLAAALAELRRDDPSCAPEPTASATPAGARASDAAGRRAGP